ncbi:Polyketide cyclase / dehydrase and lipid transport [Methyloligella halotolerans]|uniref:Polyketide cyclase / dehydrase and lipid transport n=1 Tax=Methyloligella halotolerans TaxID=1177755 RepID=A0A1E2RZ52_9HYPH|nr:SRPBCC family protein [Methyloligella halotolerans]ODA67494.1 Polyketide cyclase / dehydrase and lipid transport [Methyloligella halotolerans]
MHVEVNVPIPFSADEVWSLAGGFNLLPILSSGCLGSVLEDGGRVRVLTNTDGSTLWERMLSFDERKRTLSYLITDNKNFKSAYDVGYVGTVRIVDDGDGNSIFNYTGDFEPTPGTSPEQAEQAVQNFANDCAKGIERALKARSR